MANYEENRQNALNAASNAKNYASELRGEVKDEFGKVIESKPKHGFLSTLLSAILGSAASYTEKHCK